MPEISVIVPMYNAKKYIEQCVGSILQQDFRDFEVVLVDDVSTDGSFELCKEWYGALENVHILRHEKNRGQGAARNTGIWKARGKYIAFVDDDDVLLSNALSRLYDVAVETGAEVVAGNTHLRSEEEGGSRITSQSKFRILRPYADDYMRERVQILPPVSEQRVQEVLKIYQTSSIWMSVWGNLFARDFLLSHRILFPEKKIWAEDYLFMFPCLMKAEPYVVITDPLYIYRNHKESDSWKNSGPEYLGYLVESELEGFRYIDQYADDDRDGTNVCDGIKYALARRILVDKSRHFFRDTFELGNDGDRAVQEELEVYGRQDAFFAKIHFYLANLFVSQTMNLRAENNKLKERLKKQEQNANHER